MRRSNSAVLAVAPLVILAACGGGDRIDDGLEQRVIEAAPAAEVPDTTFTVALRSDAAATGEILFEAEGSRSLLTVSIQGAEPGVHEGFIHEGRCDAAGGSVERLEPIVADGAGAGDAHTVVELAPALLLDGTHSVQYRSSGAAGVRTLCADLPALARAAGE